MSAAPSKAAKATVADGVAADLRDIGQRLAALQHDVRACRLHRADVRLGWLQLSVKTCADGLRQQAGKLKGQT